MSPLVGTITAKPTWTRDTRIWGDRDPGWYIQFDIVVEAFDEEMKHPSVLPGEGDFRLQDFPCDDAGPWVVSGGDSTDITISEQGDFNREWVRFGPEAAWSADAIELSGTLEWMEYDDSLSYGFVDVGSWDYPLTLLS